jgi:Rnl2 family RNA ligase
MTDLSTTFKKYSSIENHYNEEYVLKLMKSEKFAEIKDWVVTEKVHGSNFSFIVSPSPLNSEKKLVQIAKRTQILDHITLSSYYPEATQTIKERYEESAKKAFDYIQENIFPEYRVTQINIFGELFGGIYTHPDVPQVRDRMPVFKEVQYCPNFDFYLFDVHVALIDKNEQEEHRWLSHDDIETMCPIVDFPIYAKALARGPFEQVINYDVVFSSTLPSRFYNLPPIDKKHHPNDPIANIVEGIVIKPNVSTHIGGRVVIKKKTSKFSEKKEAKKKVKTEKTHVDTGITETTQAAWDELERYITHNRLLNCVSKVGDVTVDRKAVGELMKMLTSDAMEEFEKENSELWNSLHKEQKKKVTKKLSNSVQGLVKEYLDEELLKKIA